MQINIKDFSKEQNTIPGIILGVLTDLGVHHDQNTFQADSDILELIRESVKEAKTSKTISLTTGKTPRDVAFLLNVPQSDIQKVLIANIKVMATLTTSLKQDVVEKVLEHYGYKAQWVEAGTKSRDKSVSLKGKVQGNQPRSPVVTIMGHVDHGKTSLLDYIRKANVAAKEFGGITQHIGAYQVELPEGKITFLDTPGHEAFTAMRARGAQVTDVAVLVVAADDGIMPQTIEAINHAKNAEVPIIVAVNKIDRPDANPDRVLNQLPEYGLIPEAFGGQTITCLVSARTGEGVTHLLEMILLQAEMLQLKANPKAEFEGVVVEAKLEKGRGPLATVLVQNGTLKVGDVLLIGTAFGRIKAMADYTGRRINEAGPSTPAEILGLSRVPKAGDTAVVMEDERVARNVAEKREEVERQKQLSGTAKKFTLRDLKSQLSQSEIQDLNMIVKSDVQGSLEAVRGLLDRIEHKEVNIKIIHSGIGSITESDVLLASAANAICVGFNVKPEPGAKREAERLKVEIRTYNIIYELVEDIEAAIKGRLAPKFEEQYQGTVEVRVVFDLSRYGRVAGSHVTDGKVTRNSHVRVRRSNEVVYEGKVASLKHIKNDVKEMTVGFDCGIQFEGWTGFEVGDTIEAYEIVQVN